MALSGTASVDRPLLSQSGDYYRALVSGRARGLCPMLQRATLRALSVPYGWATRLRNWLYDRGWKQSRRAAVPVVSIGNLTLGGTGKTPCVELVARWYQERGHRVAILSRGYGNAGGGNDEAHVLQENLPGVPHLQGTDRAALAAIAIEKFDSDVLVLDDGFQHRALARDLDIVLVDATLPWGHGFLFPRGLLREARSGLRRAGLILLTRCDQVGSAERRHLRRAVHGIAPGVSIVETVHRPVDLVNAQGQTRSLDLLAGRPVAALCGIGNPEAFRQTLQSLGARLTAFRAFPDHHPYSQGDIEELSRWAEQQDEGTLLLTTQKDLVKVSRMELGGRDLWALRIRLQTQTAEEALDRELGRVIGDQESVIRAQE